MLRAVLFLICSYPELPNTLLKEKPGSFHEGCLVSISSKHTQLALLFPGHLEDIFTEEIQNSQQEYSAIFPIFWLFRRLDDVIRVKIVPEFCAIDT